MLLTSTVRTDYLKSQHLTSHSAFKCIVSSPDGLNPQWQVSASCQGFRVDKPKAGGGRWVVLCLTLTETAYVKCYLLHRMIYCSRPNVKAETAPVSTESDFVFL